MAKDTLRFFLVGAFLLSISSPICFGQTTMARLAGLITDSSGAVVPGARVKATNLMTGIERSATSGELGYYTIPLLEPGQYELTVQKEGFRPITRSPVTLDVGQMLRIDFVLQVGTVAEQLTVTAEVTPLQAENGERSGVITGTQLDGLLIRSRSINAFLRLLPGVVDESEPEVTGAAMDTYVAGNRNNANNVTLDGMMVMAIGSGTNHSGHVSQDSVAEVKVLIANYRAEYGRVSGAHIQVVTKSGGRTFHGLGSFFLRNEYLNANNFFNNRMGVPRPTYRYQTWTYNIGGPVYVPGRFNRNRDKLFFFWSQEYWPIKAPGVLRTLTVPTELERAGDFSQSLDLNNRLITVNDPLTRQPFPGNRIPTARIDPNGQALLKFLPAPNFSDRAISGGRYNYVFQPVVDNPIRTDTLKLDYNINARNMVAAALTVGYLNYSGSVGVSTLTANWPQMRGTFATPRRPLPIRYQRIISPSTVNELYVGIQTNAGGRLQPNQEDVQRNRRDTVGFNAGQLFPADNPLNLIPNATFSDVTNPPTLSIEQRFPFYDKQKSFSLSDNLTRIAGSHSFKAGIYVDRIWTDRNGTANFNGTFSFARDANSLVATNYAYANAILGAFGTYTEASNRPAPYCRVSNVEWFAQDNWKVTRRLTLDYGLRFAEVLPLFEKDNQISGFVPQRFDPSRQVQLIQPRLVNGARVGVDVRSGTVYPAALIGAIAPGSGDPANGMVLAAKEPTYPRSLINNRGIQFAPRFGFALLPFKKGDTVIRGGFGMFYNRQNSDAVVNPFTLQQPLVDNPTIYYGTLATLLSSAGLLFPQNVAGVDQAGQVPTVMNYSFSIQQQVGFRTVLDVAYVGSLGRHLMWRRNLNAIPLGANFDPANIDPTNRALLPNSFFRPRIGYGNILFQEWAGSSNYHSLQVTAARRLSRGLEFNAAWTWSKTLDFNDADTQEVSTLVPIRVWNYGLASFDRTHMLKLNWTWEIPKVSLTNPVAKQVLQGWQLSGISSFVSGAPLGISYSTTTAADITGSASQGARGVVVGNPVLPKDQRTFSRNFRTDVFRMPEKGTVGNAAKTLIRGPGINNWDLAVTKNIAIREPMRLQFRWEMYNAFNHTQFSALDTAARFDAQGNQINARCGEFTTARLPRLMQFALRLHF